MTLADKIETRKGAVPSGSRGYMPCAVRIYAGVSERRLAAYRIAELTRQATAALGRPAPPPRLGKGPGRGGGELMTARQVAGYLKIDIATVEQWARLGVLQPDLSRDGAGRFRRQDIITFLPTRPRKGQHRRPLAAPVSGCGAGAV